MSTELKSSTPSITLTRSWSWSWGPLLQITTDRPYHLPRYIQVTREEAQLLASDLLDFAEGCEEAAEGEQG